MIEPERIETEAGITYFDITKSEDVQDEVSAPDP